MTLQDLKMSTKTIITPSEAAQILNCNPHYIRVQARTHPERLGFPVSVLGNRTKIPRLPFIKFVEGEK